MKILWDNYLIDSTITTTSEDSLYPVENLYHRFMQKKYMAESTRTTVTVLFPEDRDVSMIAYAFNNTASSSDTIVLTKGALDTVVLDAAATDTTVLTLEAQYVLKSSTGATVGTGVLEVGEYININYFTSVTCRSVELTFTSQDIVYVGCLSIGDPIEYEYMQVNPRLIDSLRSDSRKTSGGQLISRKIPMLREWRIAIPDMDNAKRLETQTMLKTVGRFRPVFADLWENATTEKPMYGSFTRAGEYRQDSNSGEYLMGLTIEEAK